MKMSSWRNIGTEVNGDSVQEIILQAGLDYEVVKEPIYILVLVKWFPIHS